MITKYIEDVLFNETKTESDFILKISSFMLVTFFVLVAGFNLANPDAARSFATLSGWTALTFLSALRYRRFLIKSNQDSPLYSMAVYPLITIMMAFSFLISY